MPRKHATTEQLESAIQQVLSRQEQPTLEVVRQILMTQDLSIKKQDYYRHLYNNHLYDWKKRAPEEVTTERRKQERISELENTLSQVKATLEATADGILMLTREGKLVNWNQKFVNMFRFPNELVETRDEPRIIQHFLDQVVDPQELFDTIARGYNDPSSKGEVSDLAFKDGRVFERYSQPHMVGKEIVGRVWSFRDVTARRKQDEELRLRERAIQASTQGVLITDNATDHTILYANPAFKRITGYSLHETKGQKGFFWCGDNEQEPALHDVRLALKEQREDSVTTPIHRRDGTLYWAEINIAPVPNAQGEVTHFIWLINDVTQRKIMEERLVHQATHDALTELPNRLLLHDRIQQMILNAKRAGLMVAIWFIDLDRFKLTNDSLGHAVGDELLKEVAKRLVKCVRETDTVARVGGDEFVIVSLLEKHESEAIPMAQKILKKLAEPIEVGNRIFNITASIGVSTYPANGTDADALMKNADIAMYRAKESGRDNFQFYTTEMNAQLSKRLSIENDLHKAIAQKEFILHYQPLVSLTTNRIASAEVLLRWQHPEKGMISPLDFIPIAEESGLIIPIGEWVLETACTQHQLWQASGLPPLRIAVNVSSQQLQRSNFLKMVDDILQKTKIPPTNLMLELTESILIDDSKKILEILNSLKARGIKLVIDDFGTGYSSLSYLKRFPIDKLKIDRSFVNGIDSDPNDAAIVQTIIAMAHILGLQVVAEGVETENQLKFLRLHQCDEIQGYYFSRPVDKEQIVGLMDKTLE